MRKTTRKTTKGGIVAALSILCLFPVATFAHHGVNGQFDLSKTLTKKGKVTRVRFVNPHSYVYFDVTEDDGDVQLTYDLMDVERTIHIDGDFPDSIEPSVIGYSVGTWNDNKLEVMTKGFAPGFLEAIGGRSTRSVPNSEQMEIAETFYVDENDELVHEYTITDPVYLAEPLSHLQKSVRIDGGYEPFNCNDLTNEEGRQAGQ